MSRRDYVLIADLLERSTDAGSDAPLEPAQRDALAEQFADRLEARQSGFHREKFLLAAGHGPTRKAAAR
jgi:hypothetical protein